DLLAEKEAQGDAERQGLEEHGPAQAVEWYAGIGEAEDRDDEKGRPGMEGVLQRMKRRRRIFRTAGGRSQGDRHGEGDASDGGMHPGFEDEEPHRGTEGEIEREAGDAQAVHA